MEIDDTKLRELLIALQSGSLAVDEALERVRHLPFEDLGFAKLDHHRALRHGLPEVVLGKGKTPEQVVAIADALLELAQNAARHPGRRRFLRRSSRRPCPTPYIFPLRRRHPCLARPRPSAARAKSPWSAPAPATCRWPRRRR